MESIEKVIKRCKGQRPDVVLAGHFGYYQHDDVQRLINEIAALRRELVRPRQSVETGYVHHIDGNPHNHSRENLRIVP